MTVYPSVEAARINPAALTKSALPAHLHRWFDEARTVYKGDQSYAFKAGYLHAVLSLIEADLQRQAEASAT